MHLNINIFTRHDDLKQMLDSAKDGPKLEAMKRIIGVIYTITILKLLIKLFNKNVYNFR